MKLGWQRSVVVTCNVGIDVTWSQPKKRKPRILRAYVIVFCSYLKRLGHFYSSMSCIRSDIIKVCYGQIGIYSILTLIGIFWGFFSSRYGNSSNLNLSHLNLAIGSLSMVVSGVFKLFFFRRVLEGYAMYRAGEAFDYVASFLVFLAVFKVYKRIIFFENKFFGWSQVYPVLSFVAFILSIAPIFLMISSRLAEIYKARILWLTSFSIQTFTYLATVMYCFLSMYDVDTSSEFIYRLFVVIFACAWGIAYSSYHIYFSYVYTGAFGCVQWAPFIVLQVMAKAIILIFCDLVNLNLFFEELNFRRHEKPILPVLLYE